MAWTCRAQSPLDRLIVVVPSIQQEATSVWRTINDIAFFEKMGYTVNLPVDPLIDVLIQKSKSGTFGADDFPSIYQLLESKVYQAESYALAKAKVQAQKPLINTIIEQLTSTTDTWDWNFKQFDHYQVVFTLYGSGGSYDPETGVITLFTTELGTFKSYENPANTIIHEIVHMGVEASIVQAYQLPHVEKERVVDKFVYLMFGDALPAYRIQHFGELDLDQALTKKEDLKHLDVILDKYMQRD